MVEVTAAGCEPTWELRAPLWTYHAIGKDTSDLDRQNPSVAPFPPSPFRLYHPRNLFVTPKCTQVQESGLQVGLLPGREARVDRIHRHSEQRTLSWSAGKIGSSTDANPLVRATSSTHAVAAMVATFAAERMCRSRVQVIRFCYLRALGISKSIV